MNDTKTAAVVGVGGGTLAGAGIGALAGHGARAFDCSNKSALNTLNKELRKNGNVYSLNGYLDGGEKITTADLTEHQCEAIRDLYIDYQTIMANKDYCFGNRIIDCTFVQKVGDTLVPVHNNELAEQCGKAQKYTATECIEYLEGLGLVDKDTYDQDSSVCETGKIGCDYKSLRRAKNWADKLKCAALTPDCINEAELTRQLTELGNVFGGITVLDGEKSNYGTTIPVGAAIGAGTGGLATAITAFVEKNNINCRVGDGLNTVAYGKSHSIDTLKDFYVKWNLRLPDTVSPTSVVSDVASWQQACSQFNSRLMDCPYVQVNLQTPGSSVYQLVSAACVISGSVCIPNASVMNSHLITPVPVINVVVNQDLHVQ